MGIQVASQRIRWLLNVADWYPSSVPTDILSNAVAKIANGADLKFEMMFNEGATLEDSTIIDFGNIDAVVVALQVATAPHNASTFWSKTIPLSEIDNTVTKAQWEGAQPNTYAQLTVNIPGSTLNAMSLSSGSVQLWMCIYGITFEQILATIAIADGGTGYHVDDVLVLDAGTLAPGAVAASILVTAIDGSGVITDAEIQEFGGYDVNPSSPNTPTEGQGSAASFTLTFTTTQRQIPYSFFQIQVVDTGMPVGNTISSPSTIGTQSFLCADGKYRKIGVTANPDGEWVTIVLDQAGQNAP